jgi:hypothetical protein
MERSQDHALQAPEVSEDMAERFASELMPPRVRYYGFIRFGDQYAEVIVHKVPGQASRQARTGTYYGTFRKAEQAVAAKNATVNVHADSLRAMACMDDERCPIPCVACDADAALARALPTLAPIAPGIIGGVAR